MKTRKWSWLGIAAAVCVAGGLWMGRHDNRAVAEDAPAAAAPVSAAATSAVHKGSLDLSLSFDGVFAPANLFEVRVNARRYQGDLIVNKAVAPGAKVARGDVLLELHRQQIDDQIGLARNDLAITEANFAKASADVRLGQQADELAMTNAKNDLANAQTNLKRWDDIDAGNYLLAGNLDVKTNDLYLQDRTDSLDQLRKMYKSEDLTNQTADIVMKQAVGELDLTKISDHLAHAADDRKVQVDAPVKREQLVLAAAQQSQALAQLRAAQAQASAIRQTSLVSAQFALNAATQKLADLNADHQAFIVVSPIAGVVEYGSFDHDAWHEIDPSHLAHGEKVQADQVLMTVYTPGQLRLVAQCPESQITLLAAGAKAKVFPTAMADAVYDGTCHAISTIGQAKGPQQMFDVAIDLPAVDARLAPGYSAGVNFEAGKVENVLLVPASAVWRGRVWVVNPDQKNANDAEPRTVVVGQTDGQETEIKSGLHEGEIVLTQAKHPGAHN